MAFFLAITVDPTANAAIIAPARPSGISATIIPIIAKNIYTTSYPSSNPSPKTNTPKEIIVIINSFTNADIFFNIGGVV